MTTITPAMQQDLLPSAATLATWGVTGATPAAVSTFAERLLFTANAFRLGLISTVILPGFNDDPHAAFTSGTATTGGDGLAQILDSFYAELQSHAETGCGHSGQQLSLADNVVLVVSGDTYQELVPGLGLG